MYLPYDQLIKEIRLIMLACRPLTLFQEQDLIEGITGRIVSEIIESLDKKQESGAKSTWLKKVLTSDLKLKASTDLKAINILGAECAGGEEVYSAAMRLHSILQDHYQVNIQACDSRNRMIKLAQKAMFNQGKIQKLKDNYRSLYMEKVSDDLYNISGELRNMIRFFKWDVVKNIEKTDEYGKYHLIFCSNIYRFYFKHIARRILTEMVPCLTEHGLLVVSANRDQASPFHEGLDFYQIGNAVIYRRNSRKIDNVSIPQFTLENDTLENQLFFCKYMFFEEQLENTQKRIEKILESQIDNFEANYLKADIYMKKEEFGKASNQYSRALIIKPDFLPARYNLAAVHLLNKNRKQALSEIDTLIESLDSVDPEDISKMVNISFGTFVELCRELKNIIDSDKTPGLSELLKISEERMDRTVEVPNIEIADVFELRQKMAETEVDLQDFQLDVTEKKKINISELPSTRNYGEDDPWLQKQKEDAERERLEELERQERDRQESETRESEQQTAEKEQHSVKDIVTEIIESRQDSQKTEVIHKNLDVEKLSPTRIEKPANALFLDAIDLSKLNLPKNLLDKYMSADDRKDSDHVQENERTTVGGTVMLSQDILNSLNAYMKKQDISGMRDAISSYLETAEDSQKDILQILDALCGTVKPGTEDTDKTGVSDTESLSCSLPGANLSISEILNRLNLMSLQKQGSEVTIRKFSRKPMRKRDK
jgi:chemotaxis methyl-accepting protein methylase